MRLDRDLNILVAAEVALGALEEFGLPALRFRIVQVHAQEVGRKERALGAALPALDLHDDVTTVIRVARDEESAQLLLRRSEVLLERRDLCGEGVVLLRQFARGGEVLPRLHPVLVRGLHLAELCVAPIDLPGPRGIRVHRRVGELNLQVFVLGQHHSH